MSPRPQTITKIQRLRFKIKNQITQEFKNQNSRTKSQKQYHKQRLKERGLRAENANKEAGLKKQRPIATTSTMVQGSSTNDENHWE